MLVQAEEALRVLPSQAAAQLVLWMPRMASWRAEGVALAWVPLPPVALVATEMRSLWELLGPLQVWAQERPGRPMFLGRWGKQVVRESPARQERVGAGAAR